MKKSKSVTQLKKELTLMRKDRDHLVKKVDAHQAFFSSIMRESVKTPSQFIDKNFITKEAIRLGSKTTLPFLYWG